jgi:F-type H+-transporting ATPase subunit gamma
MASLKEVKGRITSVKNTSKITSAMKMVASAKLHKAQKAVESMLPYEQRLYGIMSDFLQNGLEEKLQSPFMVKRGEVKRVALVVFSSNTSLCGAFNSNVIKAFKQLYKEYNTLDKESILVYPVGKKVAEAVVKMGLQPQGDYVSLADKPSFEEATNLAETLMEKYLKKEVDEVILLYHHFKSTSSQVLTRETYLPLTIDATKVEKSSMNYDFILEPSKEELVANMLPKVLHLKIYAVALDTNASEHAARTIAMQTATDNAEDLLQELTITYNKSRQQAITNELLDIMGGAQD